MNKDFFKNPYTKIVLGIIWGLGLACIFNVACNGRKCIIYKAPKPAEVENNIYEYDDKCYKYKAMETECVDEVIKH